MLPVLLPLGLYFFTTPVLGAGPSGAGAQIWPTPRPEAPPGPPPYPTENRPGREGTIPYIAPPPSARQPPPPGAGPVYVTPVPPPPPGPPPMSMQPGLPPLVTTTPTSPPGALPPIEQLDLAARLAQTVFADLAARKFQYDRNLMKQFQAASGLVVDGQYGGRSAGALQYFTGKASPPPYYEPKTIVTYAPPGMARQVAPTPTGQPIPQPQRAAGPSPVTPANAQRLDLAAKLAQAVYEDLITKTPMQLMTRSFDQDLLKQFQTAAGIQVDGRYGKQSAGAMKYFIGKYVNTPSIVGKPTPYTPPAG